MTTQQLAYAQAFAQAGCCVIPTRPDGSKAPAVRWQEYQHQHPTPEQLHQWFRHGGYAGLGLVCGSVSGGLEMLELEGRSAELGADLAQALADHDAGDLWARLCAGYLEHTPSGGYHWLYRVTGGDPRRNTKLARRPATPDELATNPADRVKVLIETRGEGGYVVTAPSNGTTHPTGRAWTLLAGGPATIPSITAAERDLLHAVCAMFDQMPAAELERTAPGPAPAYDGELRPGDDYNRRATWEEILEPHGWTKARRLGRGYAWTRPGKHPRDGFSATTDQADDADRLFVFSSSTSFDTETPYSKFAAYAHLEHDGDLAAAASALRHQGYGAPLEEAATLSIIGVPPQQPPTSPPAPPGAASSPPPDPVPPTTLERSEDGHAQMLIQAYGHLIRFCPERNRWLTWDGTRWIWQPGRGGLVREYAKAVARAWPAGDSKSIAIKRRMLSAAGISGALDLASTDPTVTVQYDKLDADPWVLNTPAGLVDLRTGQLRPSDPRALCTRLTKASPDPNADPTRWLEFLADTFDDAEIVAYMQRLVGYSAVGEVGPHILPFCHGSGGNGKGVFLEATTKVLGDYATTAPLGFLMAKSYSGHETEIARLSGARMVLCSEVNEGDRFDEAKVKQLTGGDTLTARFMKQDHFSFTPTHQLWLIGNSKPLVQTGGRAFWRRLRLVPFEREVPDDKIVDDLQGILARDHGAALISWIIAGAVAYHQGGLRTPDSVKVATADYAHDQDTVEQFLEDMCVLGDPETYTATIASVRSAYLGWCRSEGHEPLSGKAFGTALQRRGVGAKKGAKGVRQYTGLLLMATSDGPDDAPPGSRDPQDAFWWKA